MRWVRVIGRPHKRENGDIVWDSISLDVSDRKRAESALDASEQTRAAMLAAIPDPLFSHDRNGVFLDFHSASDFQTPVPPAELLGRTIWEVMPEDVAEKSMACIERAIETGETQLLEYPLTKDGQLHFFEARYVSSGNEQVLAVVRDVTESKHAEDALRASETRFRRLVENAADAFCLYDIDGNIVDANRYAEEIFGYTRDELLSLHLRDIAVNFDPRKLKDLWDKLSTGEPRTVSRLYRRKDGTTFSADVRIGGVEIDGRPHYLALARDTTERDRVQTQLAHASKMATLGEMGAGIAHELNQPMQIIRIAADHCMAMLEDGAADLKKLKSRLRKISSQTGRMSQIIDHMRVLSRRDDVPPELLNPVACATAAITYASVEFRRSGIQVSTDYSEGCSNIVGHSVQIEQAILNLLTNARDANVATRADRNGDATNGSDRSGHIEVTVKEDAKVGQVNITVVDDGGGIPESIMDRIFDPFFTTKEDGTGTGLGLSVSYGFINAMGGSLDVRNTKNGATFTITLAAADKSNTQPEAGLSAAE